MYQDRPTPTNNGLTFHARHKRIDTDDTVGVFIPTGNQKRDDKKARKLAAFWNLTPAERADRIARILAPDCGKHTYEVTLAILAAITGGRT